MAENGETTQQSLLEQQKIVELLNTAKKEIVSLRSQAEALRKQKPGLLQKLLTGQWLVQTTMKEDNNAQTC